LLLTPLLLLLSNSTAIDWKPPPGVAFFMPIIQVY